MIEPTVITVDSAISGEVTISFRENLTDEPVEVRLGAREVLTLLSRLAQNAEYAVTWAAQSAVVGDCETCRNVGLVVAKNRHGRHEQVACPDCHDRREEGFPAYPRIGGGVR